MPGTRTAPDVSLGSATFFRVTFSLIDSRGDRRTLSLRVNATPGLQEVEDAATALQAATNSSLYSVKIIQTFEGAALGSNGAGDVVESVFDNIAINYKDVAAGLQQTAYVPAPIGDLILDGDIVDVEDTVYTNIRNAYDALLAGAYAPVTARFTERREKNDAVPATA